MSTPQDPPSPPQASGRSRAARRLGCLALALLPLLPFLLLAAIVKAPVWLADHRLARMADHIRENPPPGADVGYVDAHVEVTGDSGDCWYTIRFELSTDRPVQEMLDHYRRARIEDPDGQAGDYELTVWTPMDEPGASTVSSMIIHLDGEYSGSLLELRCM
ncbi:hypothetical protein [Nonomuraea sp. NPDC048826]|uniref:hypothetical protein n=1 Tax=Nonomuraea sp. NPDC048826 TaxID=3364347 RepID=UPI00371267C9